MIYIGAMMCFLTVIILTPLVKRLAIKVGATDEPNNRKVHEKIMPRLGGLAIYVGFLLGFLIFIPETIHYWPIMLGATVIVFVGILDDLFQKSAKFKFIMQIIAAVVPVVSGFKIDFITLPFTDRIEFGFFAVPITILWIVAITNAINLIDGLDGLAAGIAAIAFLTISGLAVSMGNLPIALISLMMFGSTVGFLLFNFYPAKIFMGDTGSLFLGYMISVIAVTGLFKNVALFSLLVPIIILAIPILDTVFAVIRRIIHKKPISAPDKFHLHHCILKLGFTHKQTVILIYGMSILFSLAGIVLNRSEMWSSIIILILVLIIVELLVELTGIISESYRPLLRWLRVEKIKSR
ncbi:glycosyltransferase family 4 protein [Virgibacillus dokdonensis]|uniref:glycosyltransferase family 4 protein n=1 Tax=Virgibacillus dokdonensis TaxID=302167 RepID=UPI00098B0B35|nr:MraY family glycosyltransferase [Virgibacillus dokdonensis]